MKSVKALLIATGIISIAATAGIVFYPNQQVAHAEDFAHAEILVSLGAKQVCSCLHVAGREMESCQGDFTFDMTGITYTDENNITRATFDKGEISAEAKFTPGLGCTLVKP